MSDLTPEAVHDVLKQCFPEQNDDYVCSFEEELKELNDFGITTNKQLLDLLERRAYEVMEIDRSPMSEADIRMHIEDRGREFVTNRLRRGFWFSYPALLRIALELEFGDDYEEYAERRDGLRN
jgi:hypothetical protein